MTLTHDTGHAAEGLARLCEQYKSNADVQALLNANAVPVQAVEDALWQLQTMRLPLTDATGAQLDGLGDIIGQLRQGRSDADYILWLKARLLANASVGEPERLIEIAFLITGAVLHLVQEPPAACVLWIDGALDPDVDPLLLSQILGVAVAGGVNLQMVYALVANADAFTFADADVEQADALRGWANTSTNLFTQNVRTGTDTLGNTTGFTVVGGSTIASSSDEAWEGTKSLKVTPTNSAGSGVYAGINPGAGSLGKTYSGFAYLTGTPGKRYDVALSDITRGTFESATFTIPASGWVKAYVSHAISIGDSADLRLYVTTTDNGGGVFYADGLQVEESSAAHDWGDPYASFDGGYMADVEQI